MSKRHHHKLLAISNPATAVAIAGATLIALGFGAIEGTDGVISEAETRGLALVALILGGSGLITAVAMSWLGGRINRLTRELRAEREDTYLSGWLEGIRHHSPNLSEEDTGDIGRRPPMLP